MPNLYPQLALVTDAIAASMENTLVASKLMRWMDRGTSKIGPLNRFQVIERVPPRYNARRATGAVVNITGAKQDTVAGAEIFQLNSLIGYDFDDEDFSRVRDLDSAMKDERLRSIGRNAGEDVDADVLSFITRAGNNQTGTPGTAVNSIEALQNAYVRLKEEGVPDGTIMGVLSYSDYPALSKYLLDTVRNGAQTGETILGTLDGSIKDLLGMKLMFTQQLPVQVAGTRTNGAVNGAAQNVNYSAVALSQTTNGNFLTQTINADGFGANATIEDGAIFTIAGVNAWDNRKGASIGRLQQFRVVGNYVATAGGVVAALRIFPAIIVQNATLTGDLGVNNANATVDAAPADNAVITFLQAAGTSHLVRALVARDAVRVETAALENLPSGENSSRKMKGVPLTLRAHRYSNGDTGVVTTRFDSAYQPNVEAYGRCKIVRVNGV
jgi:hypothetical protein